MRRVLVVMAVASSPLLAGCVGDTDPATHVRATSAQLNAHGHTNNGPAKWWWEYSPRKATVSGGTATRTPIRGPASSSSDVALNETVTGLQADQPYYFRACGQDTKAGSPVTCGQVRRLRTSAANSAISVVQPPAGNPYVRYVGGTAVRHHVEFVVNSARMIATEEFSNPTGQDPPLLGATFAPGASCSASTGAAGDGFDDTASCGFFLHLDIDATFGPYGDDTAVFAGDGSVDVARGTVHLGGGDDAFDSSSTTAELTVYGEAGSDVLHGGQGDDVLHGGDGADVLFTGPGGDLLDGGPGIDEYHCETDTGSTDLVIADSQADFERAKDAGCPDVVLQP